MKKGFFVFAAGLFLLSSCDHFKSATSGGSKDATDMNAKNTENQKAVLHAIETGDASKLDSLMSKDVVDHEGKMGKDDVGLDSIKAHLGSLHNYFDNLKMEILQSATSPDGQYFFATVHMTGKAKPNPWGMPVGMEVDGTNTDLLKIKDGKITDHWTFTSQKDIMKMQNMQGGDKMQPADNTHKKM